MNMIRQLQILVIGKFSSRQKKCCYINRTELSKSYAKETEFRFIKITVTRKKECFPFIQINALKMNLKVNFYVSIETKRFIILQALFISLGLVIIQSNNTWSRINILKMTIRKFKKKILDCEMKSEKMKFILQWVTCDSWEKLKPKRIVSTIQIKYGNLPMLIALISGLDF